MDYAKLHGFLSEANARLEMVALGRRPGREMGDLCICLSQLAEVVAALLDEREQAEAERLYPERFSETDGGTAGGVAPAGSDLEAARTGGKPRPRGLLLCLVQ